MVFNTCEILIIFQKKTAFTQPLLLLGCCWYFENPWKKNSPAARFWAADGWGGEISGWLSHSGGWARKLWTNTAVHWTLNCRLLFIFIISAALNKILKSLLSSEYFDTIWYSHNDIYLTTMMIECWGWRVQGQRDQWSQLPLPPTLHTALSNTQHFNNTKLSKTSHCAEQHSALNSVKCLVLLSAVWWSVAQCSVIKVLSAAQCNVLSV